MECYVQEPKRNGFMATHILKQLYITCCCTQ
jgi:hypothetical protein